MRLRVDRTRLWDSLEAMGRIGATPAGGCNRQALTDEDRAGRDLFLRWAEEAGLSVRVDQMGNVFARRAGENKRRPPILIGSHLDTQPTGGKFDGVYGVLAGLEVVRTLNDSDTHTESALEIAVWTNEEGARFAPAMVGSGVWAGAFALEDAYAEASADGAKLGDELRRIGYLGPELARPFPIHGAFELHIEQGPILEAEERQVGIVTGVQGIRWYDITVEGVSCHAGTTPMELRRDPLQSVTSVLASFFENLPSFGAEARATVGVLHSDPTSRNTVPARVTASVDLRHPRVEQLDGLERALRETLERTCRERGTRG
ncbi:MAG: hydantoinase/carbamoylase family amidase, partial [Myxococcales bacterium]|nr:hydantoinase/carbamoylase family amidase [Myxococcales bacterium]